MHGSSAVWLMVLSLYVLSAIRRQIFKITSTSCSRINFKVVLCLKGTVFSNDGFCVLVFFLFTNVLPFDS